MGIGPVGDRVGVFMQLVPGQVLEAAIATPQINGPMTRRPVQKIAGMSCRQRFLIFFWSKASTAS
jgi:hypothetical protein